MTNKTKVFLGIAFVLVQFAAVSIFSIYYAYNIANQTKTLFTDNIRSLQYCEKMSEAVDSMNGFHVSLLSGKGAGQSLLDEPAARFEQNLASEEGNITEPGEKELVSQLKGHYENYREYIASNGNAKMDVAVYSSKIHPLYNEIKSDIHAIAEINLQPIQKKKDQAIAYEYHFYVILSIIATVCLLVSFSFLFNFPKIAEDRK